MNFGNHFHDRLPFQVEGHFRPDIQINSGDAQIPARFNCPGDVPKASFCRLRFHMAEEPVCNDEILWAEKGHQFWVYSIGTHPLNSLLQVRPDSELAVSYLKDRV